MNISALERFPCLVLQYEWNLETQILKKENFVLSKKVVYQKNDLFRLGVKNTLICSNPLGHSTKKQDATFFLLTTNLKKMGLKIKTVFLTCEDDQRNNIGREEKEMMDHKTINGKTADNKNEATQLFIVPLNRLIFNFIPEQFATHFIHLTFTIYLIGITDNFRVQQIDGLLSQQLWSTLTNQQGGTDFKLIAKDGKLFNVHKFILAARSPVFAALFNQKEIEESHYIDCTEDEMMQLVKFIYTGELEGIVGHGLMQLAAKYQMTTLEKLNQTISEDVSMDQMSMIALHLETGPHVKLHSVEYEQDEDLTNLNYETNISILTCTWNVVNIWMKNDQEILKLSVPLQYGEDKLFRVELCRCYNSSSSYIENIMKFLSHTHENISSSIEEVICSFDQVNYVTKTIKMTEGETHNKKLLRLFTAALQIDTTSHYRNKPFSCLFTFQIKLRSTIPNFINKLVDSTWSEQLWAAAVNRKMTDVEFFVGAETFGAHRSLLSARSPVFAAMFASGTVEAESGRVTIEGVDGTTFQHFLKFLYTGMFEPSTKDRDIFTVADKCRVETLTELCRPAIQAVDLEDIFKTFSSC